MNMLVSLIVLLSGILALTSVRGDTPLSDLDILAKLDALTARVDVLESRDLQHHQHAAVMRTKLALQGRELLNLRRLFERRDKTVTPPREQAEEPNDVSETDDVVTTRMSTESDHAKQDQKRDRSSIPRVRRQEVELNVAFLATLAAHTYHLGQNQNVAFDHVVTNEGNAYNPHAGLFVAPVDGTYVFSTTVTAIGRDTSHFAVVLNGNVISYMYVNGAENNYDSSAQTVVLKLQAGDDVSVKEHDSDHTITGSHYSMFSGFLLHQTFGASTVVG